ncbi:MAG TPA: HAMP domain-containing sensor histidine kinase [Terrimesophilobacter sp.]|nr:HAMP domain-containing sensor histidine kinase [Terrimesophilobacter sp.]HRP99669.1 HAMP domain-containing sensor histidine kinase [Terrimesophilobacter sp.]
MLDKLSQRWSSVSLRTKITGVTVLLVTVGLLVAGIGTLTVLRNYLINEADLKIKNLATELEQVPISMYTACQSARGAGSYYVAILSQVGSKICTNRADTQAQPDVSEMSIDYVFERGGQPATVWDEAHLQQWRVVAVPFTDTPSDAKVTLAIGLNLADVNGIIGQYSAIFLGFGLSVVILGAALTRLLVTAAFTPLREVEATAAAIADGDFSQRLAGATPNTEVGRLNRSLNTMLNRIDRAFADRARTIDQMRRFVGDASHELRTPLVSVRGYAELYRMGALQSDEEIAQAMERIEKEALRMGELVEDLLSLARLDEAKPLQLTPVDLVPLARDAALDAMAYDPDRDVTVITPEPIRVPAPPIEDTQPVATVLTRKRGVSTATGPISLAGATIARLRSRRRTHSPMATPIVEPEVSVDQPAVVMAEENKIRQVLTNLIGNAMRFSPNGSPLELVVQVDGVRRVATLDVVDHGDGVPPQIRDKIFQRFWRADTSRTRETGGSGLGLAIVAGLVAAHKGSVEVLDTPGGGATFRVSLPLLPTNEN